MSLTPKFCDKKTTLVTTGQSKKLSSKQSVISNK